MLFPRLMLIPVLLLAQVCSAASGRTLFVWCMGPHGELKLELPHDSCRHDCEAQTPAPAPVFEADAHIAPSHGCHDFPADMTVPAMRRPAAEKPPAPAPDMAPVGLSPIADRRLRWIAHAARPRPQPDQPPPALMVLRTVRLLI